MPLLMRRGGRSSGRGGGALGVLGSVRGFMSIVKEIDFNEVRERAELPPRLLVVAATDENATSIRDNVFGAEGAQFVDAQGVEAPLRELGRYDAIVVADPERQGVAERVRREFPARADEAPVFHFTGMSADDREAGARCRQDITDRLTDLAPSLGRHLPACRASAVKSIIDDAAKANAQFALISNVPSVVPIVGSLVSASADLIVLTKNQVMMLFKIAAVHNRDMRDQFAIVREIIPVVGAGLFWRTVAREAASFIPLAAGTIPKVIIAYVGTVTAGRGADFYYGAGHKAPKAQLQEYRRQAVESMARIPLPGRENHTEGTNGEVQVEQPAPTSNREG
jgi:uncharacterized protein (DUF697 family)